MMIDQNKIYNRLKTQFKSDILVSNFKDIILSIFIVDYVKQQEKPIKMSLFMELEQLFIRLNLIRKNKKR